MSPSNSDKKLASLGRITSASGHKPDPKSITRQVKNPPPRYSMLARSVTTR